MLSELCRYLRNWFLHSKGDVYRGKFVIKDGSLDISKSEKVFAPYSTEWGQTNDASSLEEKLEQEPYIRIVGSRFNDGVYIANVDNLVDEVFRGEVWVLSIPPEVIALNDEIDTWVTDNATAINSPFQSESFGGYSYSKGYVNGSSIGITWQSQFATRLSAWRKL